MVYRINGSESASRQKCGNDPGTYADLFAQTRDGQYDKDETFDQDQYESIHIGKSETDADSVNEECIQTNAGDALGLYRRAALAELENCSI